MLDLQRKKTKELLRKSTKLDLVD